MATASAFITYIDLTLDSDTENDNENQTKNSTLKRSRKEENSLIQNSIFFDEGKPDCKSKPPKKAKHTISVQEQAELARKKRQMIYENNSLLDGHKGQTCDSCGNSDPYFLCFEFNVNSCYSYFCHQCHEEEDCQPTCIYCLKYCKHG